MKVCGPMAGALSGRSRVRKPCRTRQRAGPQSRLLTYLGHKEASCVSPARELAQAGPIVARRGGGYRAQDQRTMFTICSNVALGRMSALQGPVRGGYVDQ